MLNKIKGKLIVSCQALENEPLHSSFIMSKMAIAAQLGGASGIRAQSKVDIDAIMEVCDLPMIGIIKRNYADSEVFITATRKEVEELLTTRCEMIALDATKRVRPNNEKIEDLVQMIHDHGRLAMADCSTFEECMEAERIGFDVVSSTLCGYTDYSKLIDGPNFELIERCVKNLKVPFIAEGKINTPEELAKVLELGAYCAVVGGAITRPQLITERFAKMIK